MCEWCAKQCSQHDHDHCQVCAASCLACAEACNEYAA
ncbi:four-helix bundle copper-binding protein [Bizionia myxarmorum]|nr:four-helix bundle copper-binding protein [Bizionia myxarmorum]